MRVGKILEPKHFAKICAKIEKSNNEGGLLACGQAGNNMCAYHVTSHEWAKAAVEC